MDAEQQNAEPTVSAADFHMAGSLLCAEANRPRHGHDSDAQMAALYRVADWLGVNTDCYKRVPKLAD